ncbi:IS701 family transposase, partial [Pseudomonas sp. GW460-8]
RRSRQASHYLELKQELGLGHFQGSAAFITTPLTRCTAAYGFMICERETIFPRQLATSVALPASCRPN